MPKRLIRSPRSHPMSVDVDAFTKLCQKCRRVRHVGQFPTLSGSRRKSPVCKSCEEKP